MLKNKKSSLPNIHIYQYFAATLLPAVILLGVGFSYIKTLNTDISFSKSELAILPVLEPLYLDIVNLQEMRGLQYLDSMANDHSLHTEIDNLQKKIRYIHELLYSAHPDIEKEYHEINDKHEQEFTHLKITHANPDDIFNNYSSFIFDHILFLQHIAKESNLLLDSDLDIYTLVEISVIRIPTIIEIIGQLRGRSSAWMYNGKIEEHRAQIEYMFESARKELKLLQAVISSLSKYKKIEGILNTTDISKALADYLSRFHSTLQLHPSKQQRKNLFLKGSKVIDTIHLLNKQVIDIIKLRLNERIQKQYNKQLAVMFSILMAILSMAYFISRFYKSNRDSFAAEIRTREELILSETRQRAIVDTMAEGLIIIDAKGIIQKFNPAAENMFGYLANEVADKNIKILMPEPYRSEHDAHLKNYLETDQKQDLSRFRKLTGLHKNGSTFPIELSVAEIELGRVKQFSGIMRDISERLHIDEMKDDFISSVSHELRTPLTSIKGALELIHGGVVGKLPEQAQEMFVIARNNTNHLLHIINDILDIQKITSEQKTFDFRELEIMPFLQTVIQDNAVYGAQYGVHFVISESLPEAKVRADKMRLQQVLNNLLSNAAKFSDKSETVEISVSSTNYGVRISVTDHGYGITDEFKVRVFERFTQSSSPGPRQRKGSGLGLSIAKIIIEMHEGLINFSSEKGVGSTFYIELPEYKDPPKNK